MFCRIPQDVLSRPLGGDRLRLSLLEVTRVLNGRSAPLLFKNSRLDFDSYRAYQKFLNNDFESDPLKTRKGWGDFMVKA